MKKTLLVVAIFIITCGGIHAQWDKEVGFVITNIDTPNGTDGYVALIGSDFNIVTSGSGTVRNGSLAVELEHYIAYGNYIIELGLRLTNGPLYSGWKYTGGRTYQELGINLSTYSSRLPYYNVNTRTVRIASNMFNGFYGAPPYRR